MKKTIFNLACLVSIIFMLSSCSSTNKGYQSSPVMSRNVELDPIKADISVNTLEKIKGESSSIYFLIFRLKGDNSFADGVVYSADANRSILYQLNPINILNQSRLSKVKGSAAYNALQKGDYDLFVHPNYTITTVNYFIVQKYTVKVEGYGAKYKNFRTEKQKVIITDNSKEYIFPDK